MYNILYTKSSYLGSHSEKICCALVYKYTLQQRSVAASVLNAVQTFTVPDIFEKMLLK